MANLLYPKAKGYFLTAGLDLSSLTIRVNLLLAAYSYSASHEFWSDVSANVGGGLTRATGTALGSKTTALGVFDAADATLVAPSSGACNYLVIYADSGADGTSKLLALIDTATGLPITPSGGDILITWDNGASKIFAL